MSLQARMQELITAVGTDYKQMRVWLTGSSTGDLTGLSTAAKASIVAAINELKAAQPSPASETVAGVAQSATTAETTAGTIDTDFVSPLKLAQKLTAWAQPLSANLTALSLVTPGATGKTLLAAPDAGTAKTALGLSAVATSGSASDITTGTLPTSVLPPLAINDTFPVATQAAMLALNAQRGDIAVRTDLGRNFVLTADAPSVLANWTQLLGGSDVSSVSGRVGAVTLTSADVGLSNANNTSDANKPVSTAQATADALNLKIAANLGDLANAQTARDNLSVYSQTQLGDPETNLASLYATAKA